MAISLAILSWNLYVFFMCKLNIAVKNWIRAGICRRQSFVLGNLFKIFLDYILHRVCNIWLTTVTHASTPGICITIPHVKSFPSHGGSIHQRYENFHTAHNVHSKLSMICLSSHQSSLDLIQNMWATSVGLFGAWIHKRSIPQCR